MLYRLGVVDRFRPYRPTGSAPFHYTLGDLGAVIRAAERGDDLAAARRDRIAERWSQSQQLRHLVETNGFFTSLLGTARRSDEHAELVEWWSQWRCAKAMGGLVQPDGYGVWKQDGTTVEFCLELDRGTETLGRVKAKLDGYRELENVSGVERWVLFVLPTPRREAEVRRVLAGSSMALATAVHGKESASAIWQPIKLAEERLRLIELPQPEEAQK